MLHGLGASAAVGIIPGSLGGVHVVLDVLDILAALEQQDAESLLGQLLGSPTTGDTRADYDGVIILSLHDSLRYERT